MRMRLRAAHERELVACYFAAFFSMSQAAMGGLIIPLWGVELGAGAVLIGYAVGARSLLPTLFAIHAGSVMDALGARPVLIRLAVAQIIFAMIFPFMTSFYLIIALQLVFGFVQVISWSGAQTLLSQMARGNAVAAGRFSSAAAFGAFVGPILVGVAWDFAGVQGAFALVAMWSAGLLLAVIRTVPRTSDAGVPAPQLASMLPVLVPRRTDYAATLLLLARPAMAAMAIASFLRIACVGMQISFYPLHVESLGYSGTVVGTLIGVSSLSGSVAALFMGPLARHMTIGTIMVVSVASAVVAITVTPLLGSFGPLLVFAILMGGWIGLSLPAIIMITTEAAGSGNQGRGIGLRSSTNNLAWLSIPIIMGTAVDLLGLEEAFYWTGGILGVLVLVQYFLVRKAARPNAAT